MVEDNSLNCTISGIKTTVDAVAIYELTITENIR